MPYTMLLLFVEERFIMEREEEQRRRKEKEEQHLYMKVRVSHTSVAELTRSFNVKWMLGHYG